MKINCSFAILLVGCTLAANAENFIQNSSFEAPLENQAIPHWDSAIYLPGVISDQKAVDGTHSLLMQGNGEKHIGMRQKIDVRKLQNGGKLLITTFVFVENYEQGVLKPLHFILKADGKVSYPVGFTFQKGRNPMNEWFKASAVLDLDSYEKIDSLDIFTIGWDWNGKHFKGKYYLDDIRAELLEP